MRSRVLVAVTRTGGHVIPGLTIADALKMQYREIEIRFAGAERGVEQKLVPQAGYPLFTIPAIGLSRKIHIDLIRFPWRLLRGFLKSLILVLRFQPHLVICTGGYISGPVGLGARLMGIPIVLHESNRRAGITMRLLSRVSKQVYLGFLSTWREVGGEQRFVVGNCFRADWVRIDPKEARERFELDPERFTLLVMCGSQGSIAINRVIASAAGELVDAGVQVLWQTGQAGHAAASEVAERVGRSARVKVFIEDMEGAYSAASLALTRSGAMTVSELASMGVPSLLVPLPGAVDQKANARAMERSGAAQVIPQPELDSNVIVERVTELLGDLQRLSKMAEMARKQGRPPAAPQMVREIANFGLLPVI